MKHPEFDFYYSEFDMEKSEFEVKNLYILQYAHVIEPTFVNNKNFSFMKLMSCLRPRFRDEIHQLTANILLQNMLNYKKS